MRPARWCRRWRGRHRHVTAASVWLAQGGASRSADVAGRRGAATGQSEDGEFSTASRRSGDDELLVEGSRLIIAGAKVVASSASTRRPSRASRRQLNSWLADRPFRRAVADTSRRPSWLSATIRCFSPNVQRRRAPVEITSSRETFGIGVWSVIRLCLHSRAASRKVVLGGGILSIGQDAH